MVVVSFLAMLVVMMLVVVRDRPLPTSSPMPLAAVGSDRPAEAAAVHEAIAPAIVVAPHAEAATPAPVPEPLAADADQSKYTAQWGDTVSNLAAELPGGNVKANRTAVINANPALRTDPDRLIAGRTYEIPPDASVPAAAAVVEAVPAAPARTPHAATAAVVIPDAGTHHLTYTARAGDSVSVLAAALLGEDSKTNRDAIVAANASLAPNPDRLVDGQTYRIPVGQTQPLSAADATTVEARTAGTRVGSEPDADDVVETGGARDLRYTAQPGDTVSTLAVALLGSDTPANRAAIVDHNKSLVKDADRVVAGRTYWITAPTAATH
jgi:hypothetical protein